MITCSLVIFLPLQAPKGPVGAAPNSLAGMKRPGGMPLVGLGAEGTPPPGPTTPPLEQAVRRLAGPILTFLAPIQEAQGGCSWEVCTVQSTLLGCTSMLHWLYDGYLGDSVYYLLPWLEGRCMGRIVYYFVAWS
jgi:hypothetical protein